MSHAHVVEPGRVLGHTAVDYGLGNLVFDGHSGLTSQTGVLTIDVPEVGCADRDLAPGPDRQRPADDAVRFGRRRGDPALEGLEPKLLNGMRPELLNRELLNRNADAWNS